MNVGSKSVLFIFTDIKYYYNDMERDWFEEFKDRATKELKKMVLLSME